MLGIGTSFTTGFPGDSNTRAFIFCLKVVFRSRLAAVEGYLPFKRRKRESLQKRDSSIVSALLVGLWKNRALCVKMDQNMCPAWVAKIQDVAI